MSPNEFETTTVEAALAAAGETVSLQDTLLERTHEVFTLRSNLLAVEAERDEAARQLGEVLTERDKYRTQLHNNLGMLQSAQQAVQTAKNLLLAKHNTEIRLLAAVRHVQHKWWYKLFASRRCRKFLQDATRVL